MNGTMGNRPKSPNFNFLGKIDPLLVELGMRAERYVLDDPNTALIKLRQLGELLAQTVAARCGVSIVAGERQKEQRVLIDDLYRAGAFPSDISSVFHEIRRKGNQAKS